MRTVYKEFYNFEKGAEPYRHYKGSAITFFVLFCSLFIIFLICFILGLVLRMMEFAIIFGFLSLVSLCVTFLLLHTMRNSFSTVKLCDDAVVMSWMGLKRVFPWEKVHKISKVTIYNGRSPVLFHYIVIQLDDVLYQDKEHGGDIKDDDTTMMIYFTEERFREIMKLWTDCQPETSDHNDPDETSEMPM